MCLLLLSGSAASEVVMTMLKVRCRTEVKEILSIALKGKKATGFLKPKTMPVERR